MFNSLLWLKDSKYIELEESVIADLDLQQYYQSFIDLSKDNSNIIRRMCLDTHTVKYRQAILSDFLKEDGLCRELTKGLEAFSDLTTQFSTYGKHAHNFYYLVDLIVIVETSITCIEAIYNTLNRYHYQSHGLKQLYRVVDEKIKTQSYEMMKSDLALVRKIFSSIKGAEIVLEMDQGMRPVEAHVTKLMSEPYQSPDVFKSLVNVSKEDQSFLNQYLKSYDPVFKVRKLDYNMVEKLEYGLRKYKKQLANFVNNYNKIEAEPFVNLLKEVLFYKSSVEMLSKMKKAGLPLTMPNVLEKDKKMMKLESMYNLKLTDMEAATVVFNDFEAGEHVYLLTGANSGGKTTFTQAIGQIQILAQLGLLVPAKSAQLSLASGIFTHFPVIEEDTVEMGRLGKECSDFNEIFKKADHASLILMNESFSSTSHLESIEIASEVVKAMKEKRVRGIYNTHLHELFDEVRGFNQDETHTIIALTSGSKSNINSYLIREGEPLGSSYAMEIARRYGVTFDQLEKRWEVTCNE